MKLIISSVNVTKSAGRNFIEEIFNDKLHFLCSALGKMKKKNPENRWFCIRLLLPGLFLADKGSNFIEISNTLIRLNVLIS